MGYGLVLSKDAYISQTLHDAYTSQTLQSMIHFPKGVCQCYYFCLYFDIPSVSTRTKGLHLLICDFKMHLVSLSYGTNKRKRVQTD